jgi:hypothetical protein
VSFRLTDGDNGRGDQKDPEGQRYLGRPGLDDLFSGKVIRSREIKNEMVGKAVGEWGYSQREVVDYLGMHYSTLSRLMKGMEKSTNKACC